jgi:hypothetical protein
MHGKVYHVKHFERYSKLSPTKVAAMRRSNKLEVMEKLEKIDEGFLPYLLDELAAQRALVAKSWKAGKLFEGRIKRAVSHAKALPDLFRVESDGHGLFEIVNHSYRYFLFLDPAGVNYWIEKEVTQ